MELAVKQNEEIFKNFSEGYSIFKKEQIPYEEPKYDEEKEKNIKEEEKMEFNANQIEGGMKDENNEDEKEKQEEKKRNRRRRK